MKISRRAERATVNKRIFEKIISPDGCVLRLIHVLSFSLAHFDFCQEVNGAQ